MSDPRIDELTQSARNRGLKLVRSRVRTPGKRQFGKVGLTDAKGKPVFGMDARGPTGAPEDVDDFEWFGDTIEGWVRLLSENFSLVGIDRNNAIAGALHVGGDRVACSPRL